MADFWAAIFQELENTTLAVTIRQSAWLYPALEVVHITGIVLLVGAAFLFDLRLLGFGQDLPVKSLANHLLAWSRRGLWLVVPSGFLLFMTGATELGYNATFWYKMVFLGLAGLNALIFHKLTYPLILNPNVNQGTPGSARVAGILSIVLWLLVIICGRWLAY